MFCLPRTAVSFVFTPSQHWSKRTLTDENKTLWGSWVIKGPNFRFFFAGDTGYCSIFKQIGLVYGPFNVAAIPIGAYEPRWFMKHQHVNPEEAVRIHQDLQSIFSIAIHWGTFALSNEYFLDPPRLLREALEKRRVNLKDFVTFKHGETQIISKKGGNSSVQHQHQQQQQQHQQQLQLQQTPWNMSASMFMNSNHLPNQTPFMVADPTTISSPIIQSQNRKWSTLWSTTFCPQIRHFQMYCDKPSPLFPCPPSSSFPPFPCHWIISFTCL